jgi:hypothetical protein
MGKNKKKEHAAQRNEPVVKKHHELTALELAFLEAEAKKKPEPIKKIDANEKEVGPASAVSPIVAPPTHSTIFSEPLPKTKSTFSVSAPPKAKRIYIPPQPEPKKKIVTVAQQQPERKQQNLNKPAPIETRGKPLVKLGLKPVPDEMVVLKVEVPKGDQQKQGALRSPHAVKGCGRAQVHDGNHKGESDIVIGFDFGTSSSKIVVRDAYLQTAYAVPFGDLAYSGNSYLVPTKIFIDDDGSLSLSAEGYSYDNLKIHLMDDHDHSVFTTNTSQKITASELAAAYMALVIRFARDWFLKHTEAIYKKTDIKWHINLGIPSKNYDDQIRRKTFQTIAMAAWRISRLDKTITIADVQKYLTKAKNYIVTEDQDRDQMEDELLWLHPDFVNTHPEVIMEVVGYVHSPLRTKGLHLIVDVGATTLDSATFIIHKEAGENEFPILKTTVERQGTMILHERRIQFLRSSLEGTLRQKNYIDPIARLPDLRHYEIRTEEDELFEIDSAFFKECSATIGEALRDTRDHRDPNSPSWENGFPVFICGGGGRLLRYRDIISQLEKRFVSSLSNFRGFDIKEIPKPDRLEAPDLPHEEYDRLAVAYGLSFSVDEIGKVFPESDVSNIHKVAKTRSVEDRFVSKDMC